MRLDFVQRQRAWEAEQARDAPQIPSGPVEEEDEDVYELPSSSSNAMQISSQQPDDQVDAVLQREEEELEALLEFMPGQEGDTHSEHLWSDDDDYDALFSQFMEQDAMGGQEHQIQIQTQPPPPSQDKDAMDMS